MTSYHRIGEGAPAPPVDKMYASTDIRLRMGEGAVTVEQEEHHSPLPMEQQTGVGAKVIEVGEPEDIGGGGAEPL